MVGLLNQVFDDVNGNPTGAAQRLDWRSNPASPPEEFSK
jgi:hypothetical protein